jgi:hypothetical protein
VVKSKTIDQATSNKVYVCSSLYNKFKKNNGGNLPIYVDLIGYYFILAEDPLLGSDQMSVSGVTRSQLKISITMDHPTISLFNFTGSENCLIGNCRFRVRCPGLKDFKEVKEKDLEKVFKEKFQRHIFRPGQQFFYKHEVSSFFL